MIIITSIFSPTPAITRFARLKPNEVIVVGDRKSPSNWHEDGVEFISADRQASMGFRCAGLLPWDHYSRKNIGYLRGIQRGAEVIMESDDDNLPLDGWSFPDFHGTFPELGGVDFVNMYSYFCSEFVWPRGLPLDVVLSRESPTAEPRAGRVGVWQALADGDPDVDAIYRLTRNTPVTFDKESEPHLLAPGTICPFNSQNTAFTKDAFPLLYLPATVTFRFTDILRGLVAQPILWAAGLQLGFTTATVLQERNAHDYMQDFVSEIPCYVEVRRVVEIVRATVSTKLGIAPNLRNVYAALAAAGIVAIRELELVDAWLADLADLGD